MVFPLSLKLQLIEVYRDYGSEQVDLLQTQLNHIQAKTEILLSGSMNKTMFMDIFGYSVKWKNQQATVLFVQLIPESQIQYHHTQLRLMKEIYLSAWMCIRVKKRSRRRQKKQTTLSCSWWGTSWRQNFPRWSENTARHWLREAPRTPTKFCVSLFCLARTSGILLIG